MTPPNFFIGHSPEMFDDPRCTEVVRPDGAVFRFFPPIWRFDGWSKDGHPYYVRHEQVTLTRGSEQIDVDAGMVRMLTELWRLNLDTRHSCQGGDLEEAYINFDSESTLKSFLDLTGPRGYETSVTAVYFPAEDVPELTDLLGAL